MNVPLKLFGSITKKQIVFSLNLKIEKFNSKSLDFFNNNKDINLKDLFEKKNKNLFIDVFSLYNKQINYLTYKEDSWYNVKVPFYDYFLESLLIFDISNVSQKFSEKVGEIDYMEHIVDDAYYCLSQENLSLLGNRMITYWKTVRDQYPYTTNIKIDKIYSDLLLNGCLGISVNDDFLITLNEKNNKEKIINIMNQNKLHNIEWSI